MIVTISGKSVAELREKLTALSKEFGCDTVTTQMNLPLEKTEKNEEKTEQRGRKPKVVEETPPPVETPPVVTEAATETPVTVTKEQTVAALTELNGAKGLPKAREILLKYGAARISELKPEHFGAFVNSCKEALI